MLDLLNDRIEVSTICCECARRMDISVVLIVSMAELGAKYPNTSIKTISDRCHPCTMRILNLEAWQQHARGI